MKTSAPALSPQAVAFGLAAAIASLANAAVVVVKEKNQTVRAAMQHLTGSHWITHVLIVLTIFFALGFSLSRLNGGRGIVAPAGRLIQILVLASAIASIVIVGFYVFAG